MWKQLYVPDICEWLYHYFEKCIANAFLITMSVFAADWRNLVLFVFFLLLLLNVLCKKIEGLCFMTFTFFKRIHFCYTKYNRFQGLLILSKTMWYKSFTVSINVFFEITYYSENQHLKLSYEIFKTFSSRRKLKDREVRRKWWTWWKVS